MRLPASERIRWLLLVVVGALVLAAVDIWWVATYRHGYPLNVDEVGYTTIGVVEYLNLRGGGLDGWWEALQNQPPNAPLVPALTSLVMLVKAGVMQGIRGSDRLPVSAHSCDLRNRRASRRPTPWSTQCAGCGN